MSRVTDPPPNLLVFTPLSSSAFVFFRPRSFPYPPRYASPSLSPSVAPKLPSTLPDCLHTSSILSLSSLRLVSFCSTCYDSPQSLVSSHLHPPCIHILPSSSVSLSSASLRSCCYITLPPPDNQELLLTYFSHLFLCSLITFRCFLTLPSQMVPSITFFTLFSPALLPYLPQSSFFFSFFLLHSRLNALRAVFSALSLSSLC